MIKKVVVTGCFQYLHEGHMDLLRTAFSLGEIIILLNSDEGVLELKGYLGVDFENRKEELLSTGLVNEVIKFDTDPVEQLARIKPDYIVAGEDHTREEIMAKGGEFAKEIIIIQHRKCSLTGKKISSREMFKND
jgi:cytidyltransferase-like protein